MNELITAITTAASSVANAKTDAAAKAEALATATTADAAAKETLSTSVADFDSAVAAFKAAL